MTSMSNLVGLEDVRKAATRLAGHVVRTPLLPCPWADPDRPLWLKPESLQPTGAFKLRGATNAVAVLPPDAAERGVVAHSSGNHAQALAYAARAAGIPATIVMPLDASAVKVEATRELGARVVRVDAADREPATARIVADTGAVLVHPFDDEAVIAGQGTVGLEIADDLPEVDLVLVPVGGGGLVSGVATAVKTLCPRAAVVGVEPELAADLADSLSRGERVAWTAQQTARTSADGLRVPQVGDLPWAHVRALVDDVLTVSEAAIAAAMRRLATRSRLVAEPSGAVTVAAYEHCRDRLPAGRTVAVVSGGNVEPALLAGVLGSRSIEE